MDNISNKFPSDEVEPGGTLARRRLGGLVGPLAGSGPTIRATSDAVTTSVDAIVNTRTTLSRTASVLDRTVAALRTSASLIDTAHARTDSVGSVIPRQSDNDSASPLAEAAD